LTFVHPGREFARRMPNPKLHEKSYISSDPFDSNICKSANQTGVQMLESDH
jgi:hypothetical protein